MVCQIELTVPHFLRKELFGKGIFIRNESRTVQQVIPITGKVALSADEMVIADVTFDLPEDKAVRCHHETIDLRIHPFLPEDVRHD